MELEHTLARYFLSPLGVDALLVKDDGGVAAVLEHVGRRPRVSVANRDEHRRPPDAHVDGKEALSDGCALAAASSPVAHPTPPPHERGAGGVRVPVEAELIPKAAGARRGGRGPARRVLPPLRVLGAGVERPRWFNPLPSRREADGIEIRVALLQAFIGPRAHQIRRQKVLGAELAKGREPALVLRDNLEHFVDPESARVWRDFVVGGERDLEQVLALEVSPVEGLLGTRREHAHRLGDGALAQQQRQLELIAQHVARAEGDHLGHERRRRRLADRHAKLAAADAQRP
eukprot:3750474-Pleurochrysis_carterae.AAC.1